MQTPDATNENFILAAELIDNTAQNIFLTGKAGTGKTTFLKFIREHTYKNAAVVAPTGVAAINAGGVTMHSFFQLPFEPYIPVHSGMNSPLTNQSNLFAKVRLGRAKLELMEELELLIIDEVSMLRCDQLDCIDTILKTARKEPSRPFGGVQLLFIGDLFQLPPVAKDSDWTLLKEYYDSPFFFDAKVFHENPPLYIELKKVYRQKEQHYIDLLNHVRNNCMEPEDFELLHKRYDPSYTARPSEHYITITTHNYKADAINSEELKKLPGTELLFRGEVEDEFPENAFPAELNMVLKPGAQVMFIKNDAGEERKYYNGKLAVIKKISKEQIVVAMQDNGEELQLEKEEWENVRYVLNKGTGRIEEEVLGKFRQYPIRLAWAITIHKSQGLTFEKVIVDAGRSFASGQVYVALSRCTTLEGMILLSGIDARVITTDERILEFSKKENAAAELNAILKEEKKKFLADKLEEAFNWRKLVQLYAEYVEYIPEKNIPGKNEAVALSINLLNKVNEQFILAEKFRKQIRSLIAKGGLSETGLPEEKVQRAIAWFSRAIGDELLIPMRTHLDQLRHAAKTKQYKKYAGEVISATEGFLKKLYATRYGDIVFMKDENEIGKYIAKRPEEKPVKEKTQKREKGSSQLETLMLFRQKMTQAEIAKLRNLAISTIESHLAGFISSGDVDITDLMSREKVKSVIAVLLSNPDQNLSEIKRNLGEDFSYGEVRAAFNYWNKVKEVEK